MLRRATRTGGSNLHGWVALLFMSARCTHVPPVLHSAAGVPDSQSPKPARLYSAYRSRSLAVSPVSPPKCRPSSTPTVCFTIPTPIKKRQGLVTITYTRCLKPRHRSEPSPPAPQKRGLEHHLSSAATCQRWITRTPPTLRGLLLSRSTTSFRLASRL